MFLQAMVELVIVGINYTKTHQGWQGNTTKDNAQSNSVHVCVRQADGQPYRDRRESGAVQLRLPPIYVEHRANMWLNPHVN